MLERVIFVAPGESAQAAVTRPASGLASLPSPLFQEVVDAVRFESDATRRAIHRLCRVPTCDLRVRVGDAGMLVVSGRCLCRDFLADMLVEADGFLVARARRLNNPPGAVRIHVRKRAGEWTRRRRVDVGAQARTDRLRASVIGAALPDDYHRALLEYVAEEAGSLAPLGDEGALHRRLAELAADEFGGAVADHLPRIAPTLAVVEATCRSARRVAAYPGATWLVTWWDRYIEAPMGRRPRLDEVPLDARHSDAVAGADQADAFDDADVVATVLRVFAAAAGAGLAAALRAVAAELVRKELLSADAARSFVADPGRMGVAAEQVRMLMAA